jgi:hypothetical protein
MTISLAEILVLLDAAQTASCICNMGHYDSATYLGVIKSVTGKIGGILLQVEEVQE